MAKPGTVLALDQGTTSSRAIVFGPDLAILRAGAARVRPALPGLGLGRARPRGHLAHDSGDGAACARRRQARRVGYCRDRHHQPARDLRAVGPPHRQADPPRHRLAGPPHRGRLPQAEGGRQRGRRHGQDRPAARSLFLGDQDRLAARQRGGRAGIGQGRPSRLRHHRHVPAVAPDRRPRARHGRHQRLAHAALRHRQGRVRRRAAGALRYSPRDPARGARLQCRVRHHRALDPRRRAADPGRGGRPAGGDHRPGLLRAGHGEGDLRHGLLCAAEHGRQARRLAQPAADHGRLPARRQAHLCAGGRHLHRRRGGAVAARRLANYRVRAGERNARSGGGWHAGCVPGAGLRRARRALLAARRARRASSA